MGLWSCPPTVNEPNLNSITGSKNIKTTLILSAKSSKPVNPCALRRRTKIPVVPQQKPVRHKDKSASVVGKKKSKSRGDGRLKIRLVFHLELLELRINTPFELDNTPDTGAYVRIHWCSSAIICGFPYYAVIVITPLYAKYKLINKINAADR